jgi:hypothetical protein
MGKAKMYDQEDKLNWWHKVPGKSDRRLEKTA